MLQKPFLVLGILRVLEAAHKKAYPSAHPPHKKGRNRQLPNKQMAPNPARKSVESRRVIQGDTKLRRHVLWLRV
jgi:hypothetical protein